MLRKKKEQKQPQTAITTTLEKQEKLIFRVVTLHYLKYPVCNKKLWGMQRSKKAWTIQNKKMLSIEISTDEAHMFDLLDKDFKLA